MSDFAVGDRVVVSERYRGAGCNHGAIGFYGHVVSVDAENSAPSRWDRYVRVKFQGHINGSTAEGFDHYMSKCGKRGFPCYGFELDHAD